MEIVITSINNDILVLPVPLAPLKKMKATAKKNMVPLTTFKVGMAAFIKLKSLHFSR